MQDFCEHLPLLGLPGGVSETRQVSVLSPCGLAGFRAPPEGEARKSTYHTTDYMGFRVCIQALMRHSVVQPYRVTRNP